VTVGQVKNKFLLADASEFDGYRDLMLCVVFRGESGLGIIGEIQLHDRQLFDLKSKVLSSSLASKCRH